MNVIPVRSQALRAQANIIWSLVVFHLIRRHNISLATWNDIFWWFQKWEELGRWQKTAHFLFWSDAMCWYEHTGGDLESLSAPTPLELSEGICFYKYYNLDIFRLTLLKNNLKYLKTSWPHRLCLYREMLNLFKIIVFSLSLLLGFIFLSRKKSWCLFVAKSDLRAQYR